MVLNSNGGFIGLPSEAFYLSFAADVKAFLEPMVHNVAVN